MAQLHAATHRSTAPGAHPLQRPHPHLGKSSLNAVPKLVAGANLAGDASDRKVRRDAAEPVTGRLRSTVEKPKYDEQRLTFRGQLVKWFRQPAECQEAILAGFEKLGWPSRIENPLSAKPGLNSKRRLHDAIKNLNRHQHYCGIVFFADGTGQGVCWRAIDRT